MGLDAGAFQLPDEHTSTGAQGSTPLVLHLQFCFFVVGEHQCM